MGSMLEHALSYRRRGWSLVPSRNKIPLVKWEEFKNRLPTEEEITKWWGFWPDASISVITGKISGIVVVDVEKGGDFSFLPIDTPTVASGGGGKHFYYRWTEEVQSRNRVRDLVDVKGDGGLITVPPSMHVHGNLYLWEREGEMIAFPVHLFPKTEQVPDWLLQKIDGVSHGERNSTAAQMTGLFLKRIPPEKWETEAWPMLVTWNRSNDPPLPDNDLKSVFMSIMRKESKNVSKLPDWVRKSSDNKEECLIEDINWGSAIELGTNELLATKSSDCVSFGYDFFDDALTGIFPGELVVLGGESGCGKTSLSMSMAYNLARLGKKTYVFALEDRIEDYMMKAIFFSMNKLWRLEHEDGFQRFTWNSFRRNMYSKDEEFKKYFEAAKKDLDFRGITFAKTNSRMTVEALMEKVDEKTKEGYDLFIIDHLHYFDLDAGNDGRPIFIENFMVNLRTMQRRNLARILMICHYRKLNGEAPTLDSFKDSISIVQNANYVINLWRWRPKLNIKKMGDETKAEDVMKKTQESIEKEGKSRYSLMTILIPKARNPNGETMLFVNYDKWTGSYTTTKTCGSGDNPVPDGFAPYYVNS